MVRSAPYVSVLAALCVVTGCSQQVELPDRSDPVVQAEEARLAVLMEESTWVENAVCQVRLLRQEGETSWGMGKCDGAAPDGVVFQGLVVPLRVDGDVMLAPLDGQRYVPNVEELFPADLADEILQGSQRVLP